MRWRTLSILGAMMGLVIGYYWVNKPFDFTIVSAFASIFLDLIPVCLLVVCGGSIGYWLLNRLELKIEGRAERFVLTALLGMGIISNYALVIGLLGGFNALILWLPTVLGGGQDYLLHKAVG